jgi:hypothetical protein
MLTRVLDLYQEQSTEFAELAADYGKAVKQVARGKGGNVYTQLLLQDYQGGADGDAYVTTHLEGKRHEKAPGSEAEVHIYEVPWADLDQLRAGRAPVEGPAVCLYHHRSRLGYMLAT